jgi:hypothetical protein
LKFIFNLKGISTGKPPPGSRNQLFIYQLSMVPSCGAGCRLLVTWLLAGYRVTECLVTGLSFDSSSISPLATGFMVPP